MKRYLFFTLLFILVMGALGMKFYRMDEETETSATVVDLSNQNLKEIPDEYKEQILKAEVLILDGNDIAYLPLWLKEARSLTKISIDNNPNFDFFQFTVDFQEMKQLKEFSAEGNNILIIPYQITYFKELSKLDLSNNSIVNVPYHLGFMESLVEIDLSDNFITQVGFSFRDLHFLKILDISSNEKLNIDELCHSLEGHNLESLKIDFLDSVPSMFSQIKVSKLDITFPNQILIGQTFVSKSCKSLILRGNQQALSDRILVHLTECDEMTKLILSDFSIQECNEKLKGMKNLRNLEILSCELSSIDELKEMHQLSYLNVSDNKLERNQINELKTNLKNCNIVSDVVDLVSPDYLTKIEAPIREIEIPTEEKIMDPNKETKFISSSGTTELLIPANAFLDENGKLVTSPVKIEFKEYNDPVSVALSGIPMQVETKDGNLGDFNSAGMFEINATSNGKQVFLDENKPIEGAVFSDKDTSYNFYEFNEGKGWQQVQESPIYPEILDVANNSRMNEVEDNGFLNDTVITMRRALVYPKIMMKLKNSNSNKNFLIQLMVPDMYKSSTDESMTIVEFPKSYKKMLRTQFVYNGFNYKEDFAMMDSISKILTKSYNKKRNVRKYRENGRKKYSYRYNEDVLLKDVSLKPDKKADDFVLGFKFCGKPYSIHVILSEEGKTVKEVQKANEKFYQNYYFSESEFKKGEEKVLKDYKEFYNIVEKRSSEWKNQNGISSFNKELVSNTKAAFRFKLPRLGLFNCDFISLPVRSFKLSARFKDALGKSLVFLKIIIIDKLNRFVRTVDVNQSLIAQNEFTINYNNNNTAMVFVMENGNLGILSSKELNRNRKKDEIEVKVIDSKEYSIKQLGEML